MTLTITPDPFQLYPEFDVPDWTRLKIDEIPTERITGFIDACLQDKEFRQIMMHQYGSLIVGASRNLLMRTNIELMEPLGCLIDMMDTYDNGYDTDDANSTKTPDWKQLKKDQRARALREYWERIRKRKERMRKLAKLFPRTMDLPANALSVQPNMSDSNILTDFVEPFSPIGTARRNFESDLADIQKIGISRQLPWHQIIAQEIADGKSTLHALTQTQIIPNKRQDKTIKFQTLLEKAHQREIELTQEKSFGLIQIKSITNTESNKENNTTTDTTTKITTKTTTNTNIKIRDESGTDYPLDWSELNQAQRKKVIADLQQSKVVLI